MEDVPIAEPLVAEAVKTGAPQRPGRELAEELHHAEYPGLVRFLLLNGASWNEAQDAAQDAFTQMCRPGARIAYPKAWLRKVAWRSWLRQQVRHEDLCAEVPRTPAPHWQTPAHSMELGVQERYVVQLLLGLPAKQRAALAWSLDGFTTQESAEAMGTSAVAVRQNLARARAALKAQLGLEEPADGTQEEER
ncbi:MULTISPECIES: sigma-70 family RNA polymerase sigma factor [unclassified Streptomyces]|uniref:RNA polymerase sigma factor n=1 Tax=unclassified Streptomyces TaxID=2593676 RepID=UPI00081EF41F|nr:MULTISPECIES: sigma-70 family RNA polymerase sigma factor [unclassified Streptomyces]MYZ36470.1 sigma-70 family RNA polymerase sigma factor [Streptomyces sp. SID4917]SCF83801.1 RNA polymerase sigma-70 factor, ECF subfamily [Streptomyces sp. MnatMP-M17]